MADNQIIELTAEIVSAHVSNNNVAASDVPTLIRSVFDALSKTAEPKTEEAPKQEPAVSVRASVKPDYIVCLEDGAKLKMLKRYLRTNYNMSPEEYRAKWGLPRDYPMVAPNYAEQRRALAHQIGLGRKRDADQPKGGRRPAAKKAEAAAKPGRKPRASKAREAAQAHLEGAEG